jgi:hypothetical protein
MKHAMSVLLALALSACGDIETQETDAAVDAPPDAETDAGTDIPIDAPNDAPPPKEARELTSGGGRMVGATYTFEVQLGHGLDQRPMQGSAHRLDPNTAIKP